MGQQITDKKLNNRRFRKTEEAILEAFFGNKVVLSARVIAKRAKVSRSTLYRHHRAVYRIVPDYEEYILDKYKKLIRYLIKNKGIKVKTVYYQTLFFILRNKTIFKLTVDFNNGETIEKIIKRILPKIVDEYKLQKNCEKALKIYKKEIAGLIEDWIKNDFVEEERVVLNNIMYLTNTLRRRLMPLTDNN